MQQQVRRDGLAAVAEQRRIQEEEEQRVRDRDLASQQRRREEEEQRQYGIMGGTTGRQANSRLQVVLRFGVLHQIYVVCMAVGNFSVAVMVSWVAQGRVIQVSDLWNFE